MILVNRLDGVPVALNCDLIEQVEAAPRTVLHMVDGSSVVVQDSIEDVIAKVRAFRASVLVMAQQLEAQQDHAVHLRVVPEAPPE
jgi:flagellar protein FlbD